MLNRVGRDFSKWWDQLTSLGLRIPLGKVTLSQNFRPLGCVTADRGAFELFAWHYIRPKFQSCPILLKLKMQSLLTLLISELPRLSILTHKYGFYQANLPRWNRPMWGPVSLLDKNCIYRSKLTNGVVLISGGPGDFVFSISAQSDDFEILTLCSAWENL